MATLPEGRFSAFEISRTLWPLISLARKRHPQGVKAFVERYGPLVRAYLKFQGLSDVDAEDLGQEVFARLFSSGILKEAHPSKGRFRSLLCGVTRNVLREEGKKRRALKRGGGEEALSLEASAREDGAPLADLVAAPRTDERWDRLWVAQMIKRGLEDLKKEYPHYARAIQWHAVQRMDLKAIAEKTGRSVQDVKNHLRRGRDALARIMKGYISEYSSSADEYREELSLINRYLSAID